MTFNLLNVKIKIMSEVIKLEALLSKYSHLPKSFFITFGLHCVYSVKHLFKHEDSIKFLDITQLWLDGKATDEEVKAVYRDYCTDFHIIGADRYNADYAAYNILYAAAIAYGDYTTVVHTATLRASRPTSYTILEKHSILLKYQAEFVRMLKSLSKVEKLIYNIDEKDL